MVKLFVEPNVTGTKLHDDGYLFSREVFHQLYPFLQGG